MGWSSRITTDKEITEKILDNILEKAPLELNSAMGKSRQPWGWHMATNVELLVKNEIQISGSWSMSGNMADPMRNYLRKELKALGYKVKTTKPK